MKVRKTVEISAYELARFLKAELKIEAHVGDIDIQTTGKVDRIGDSGVKSALSSITLTWEEGREPSGQWDR